MTMTLFKPESSSRAHNTLVRAVYLKRVKALLSRNADELKGLLHDIRRSLFQISNIRAFVVGNIKTLPEPVSAWDVLVAAFPDGDSGEPPKDFKTRKNFLSEIGQRPGKVAHIVPMATLDSSYALFAAKGIDSYADARLPAFLVALAYLDMSEGPMWVSIRGTGLAYGTYFHNLFDCGLLHFCIHRSPDVFKAYDAGRKTVEGYADGSSAFEKGTMEGAVSSIVSQFANEQPTMLDAAKLSFTNQVIRGVSKDWQQQILKQIRTVTEAEIRDVYANIILPVFRPESCALVVTCAKLMSEVSCGYGLMEVHLTLGQGLQRNFEEAGFKAEVRTLASFQESYGFHDELGDDDVDGVDDDDDDAEDDDDGESDESEEGGVGGKGRSG